MGIDFKDLAARVGKTLVQAFVAFVALMETSIIEQGDIVEGVKIAAAAAVAALAHNLLLAAWVQKLKGLYQEFKSGNKDIGELL